MRDSPGRQSPVGGLAGVFEQNGGLLQLLIEDVPVVRVSGKRPRTNHQAALVRDRNAGFDAELVRLPGFALADALHFRGLECVELVLVLRLLCAGCARPA